MLLRTALLAALLATSAASPAFSKWREARTKHFIIYSEQSADELKTYAQNLERFDAAVRVVRRMDDPPLTEGAKLTIYILPNVDAVRRLVRGGEDSAILGFYEGRASGSVAFLSADKSQRRDEIDPVEVFQHEYLHHLMLSGQRTPLPSWLVEGGAEFFATARVEKDGTVLIGAPPQSRAYSVLADIGFNAEALVAGKPARTWEERGSQYAKGWVLAHYLTFAPERRGQLTAYMRAISNGTPFLEAGKLAFGDLRRLDRDIDGYARKKFSGLKVPPGPTPAVQVRDVSPGQSAIMNVRIRSDAGVDRTTARSVASDARKVAAQYPNDAFVQGTLAEAEFDVENYAGAIAAADRALSVDANNVQALTYKGRALMELGRKEPAKADWAEVRRWLVKANKADTENAEPMVLYYESFKVAGQKPTKAAVDGLVYAQALAPQDRDLRYQAMRELLAGGRVEEASELFGVLVYDPHSAIGKDPNMVAAMDRMKAGDGSGATALLERSEKDLEAKAKGKAKA